MNSPRLRKAASGFLALLLLFYVGYQIYKSHFSSIKTEAAMYYTASSTVQASVLALRNEMVLASPPKGAVDYVVSSGSRVASGGTVANVYESEDQISAVHQMQQIDSAVSRLQSLQQQRGAYSFSAETANERICQKLTDILGSIGSGEMDQAESQKSALLTLLNEKEIGTGEVKNFSSRISALQTERKTLEKQAGTPVGTVVSPQAGYFIQSTDGMERAYDISKVGSITCADVKNLQAAKLTPVSGAAGKISQDFDWYLVCTLPADQLVSFRQLDTGDSLSVQFPFASNMSVAVTLKAINASSDGSEGAVVLECKEMNADLADIRRETANIQLGQFTGLRVSQKAVHYADVEKTGKDAKGKQYKVKKNVMGVYVMHGNQLAFRQIIPEFSTSGYVICSPTPDSDSLMTSDTVKYSDEVVVEGTDLYDGKVVK